MRTGMRHDYRHIHQVVVMGVTYQDIGTPWNGSLDFFNCRGELPKEVWIKVVC